jgi:hypothetical protein
MPGRTFPSDAAVQTIRHKAGGMNKPVHHRHGFLDATSGYSWMITRLSGLLESDCA